jgi:hypothetical protein
MAQLRPRRSRPSRASAAVTNWTPPLRRRSRALARRQARADRGGICAVACRSRARSNHLRRHLGRPWGVPWRVPWRVPWGRPLWRRAHACAAGAREVARFEGQWSLPAAGHQRTHSPVTCHVSIALGGGSRCCLWRVATPGPCDHCPRSLPQIPAPDRRFTGAHAFVARRARLPICTERRPVGRVSAPALLFAIAPV